MKTYSRHDSRRKLCPYPERIGSSTDRWLIDPYNDFISDGGKIWPRISAVAEANQCIQHMLEVLQAARKAGSESFMRCTVGIVRVITSLANVPQRR